MVCEIICVGTELLLGNIVNTNAAFIAKELSAIGINNYYQVVVGDNEERIYEAVSLGISRSDVLILSGGLGPTKDDLTKEIVAKVLKKDLVLDLETKEYIKSIFLKMGRTNITENNWKQAYNIHGATIVKNQNGTAPGIIATHESGCKIILLPGPPHELISMMKIDIIPYLQGLTKKILYSNMVSITGIGESQAETMILDLIENQSNPTIAPYAKTSQVDFRVTASCSSIEDGKRMVAPIIEKLYERFGRHIFTTTEESLAEVVYQLLLEKHYTLAVAESCTGGLLSSTLIEIDGISKVYKEGFITYSNEAKEKYLGVSHSTLETYGAVSEETAYEMAMGVLNTTKANTSIAITGIAGPTGGTDDKPVGLVYIAIGIEGNVIVYKKNFFGSRQKVRESAAITALNLLRLGLLEL